jgi:predicted RNA-binding Zn-ribbon protein involved in translation (DUF1610 family)
MTLRPCFILDLTCPSCGDMRLTIAPEDYRQLFMPCPKCGLEAMVRAKNEAKTSEQLPIVTEPLYVWGNSAKRTATGGLRRSRV